MDLNLNGFNIILIHLYKFIQNTIHFLSNSPQVFAQIRGVPNSLRAIFTCSSLGVMPVGFI